jgi:hypothetical protein
MVIIHFRFASFRFNILTMPRDNIPASATKKLQQFFTKTLGKDFFSLKISIIILFRMYRYQQWWACQLDWFRSGYWSNYWNMASKIFIRSILVDCIKGWSRKECSIKSFTQTSWTTFSKILLGFMCSWWCK